MKIYKNIRLAYLASGLSLAVLVLLGFFYMEVSRTQVLYIDAVEHTYKVLNSINFCEKMLFEAEASQRGYLLTGENSHKEIFESTTPLIDSSLKKIGALTGDNAGQKTFYIQLTKYVRAKIAIMKANLLVKRDDPFYFENIRKGMVAMDNCRYYMGKMRSVEEALLDERVQLKNKYQRLNLTFFKATFITSCLICLVAIVIFFRELSIRLIAQQNLKAKVIELSNRKQELEEITFAASHDLQEPMRKVRILSTMMTKKFAQKISETDLEVVHRINTITEQMHGRLHDLVLYTNLLNPNEKYAQVNLYDVFKDAYQKVFANENGQFKIFQQMPTIYGSPVQLGIMLCHLLDNALKYKAAERELVITVSYELKLIKESKHFLEYPPSKKYHQVTVTDNGIGFDKQYSDKIFGLFQRLHTQSEYPGKGIGLSIARRVMANHNGYISADGEKKSGASFILYFPVEG